MSSFRIFASRLRALFGRRALDGALDDEIQAHIDLLTSENLRNGMPADEARYAALRSFGGIAQVKDEYRQARSLPFVETTLHDFRYAVRSLSKRHGFLLTAVLSLALGIGANIAIFSLLYAALLKPLPFPESHELVLLFESTKGGRTLVSHPNLEDWRQQNEVSKISQPLAETA